MKSTIKKYIEGTLGQVLVDGMNYDDTIGFVTFNVDTDNVSKFMEEFETFADNCHSELMLKPAVGTGNTFKFSIVVTDLDTINENCYLIEHGVRECALEAVDTRFYEVAKRFIQDEWGLRIFKSREILREGEITSFFIYKEPVVQALINAYETQSDGIMREALLGKILGYSASDCHDFLMSKIGDWIEGIPEEHRAEMMNDDEYPAYFNFVGNVRADYVQEEFIINVNPDKRQKMYHVLIESVIPGDFISDGVTKVLLETPDANEAIECFNEHLQGLYDDGFTDEQRENGKADVIVGRIDENDEAECLWLRVKEI